MLIARSTHYLAASHTRERES